MTYRATNESSSQTPQERVDEARRILFGCGLNDVAERGELGPRERDFVAGMVSSLDINGDAATVTVKQLWWLRDLKEKYCD